MEEIQFLTPGDVSASAGENGGKQMLLMEPMQVGKLSLRNRIVMPPMATGKAVQGQPDDGLTAYYAARAEGTALIIVEHAFVSAEGMAHAGQLSMAGDEVVPAFRKLTAAVHERGCAIFAQISHAGAKAQDTGMRAISPSGISVWEKIPASDPMTEEDIARVTAAFAAAALRVKEAGFDGVEVHSAHGYLLNQFYSPLTNHRTDAYAAAAPGGRTRLHREVLRAVREKVGPDFPVAIRFGACDYMEGGSGIHDIPEAARAFEEAGADLLDITGGLGGFTVRDRTEPGWFAELSRPARESVHIPVLLTGGVRTAEEAEALLRAGDADLIGVGRAMLGDPDWAARAAGLKT